MLIPYLMGTGCRLIYRGGDDGDDGGSGGSGSPADNSGYDPNDEGNDGGWANNPDATSPDDGRAFGDDDGQGSGGGSGGIGYQSDADQIAANPETAAAAQAGYANGPGTSGWATTPGMNEQQFQDEQDSKTAGNFAGLSNALNNGSLSLGYDSNAAKAGAAIGGFAAGPVGSVIGQALGGAIGGSSYTSGVGFSSPEAEAAIAGMAGQGGAQTSNSGGQDGGQGGLGAGDGGDYEAPTTTPTPAQVAGKIGVITSPNTPAQGSPGGNIAAVGTLIPMAEQMWWGRNNRQGG